MKTRTPDRKWSYLLFCALRRIIDSPLLQPRNKGLSCRVRFHHPNLLFVSFSRRVQRPLRCTRTPTAVKGNAYARFRTTACRLRSHRTLSASGRFSTSDSPPSIPLNLYSKGAAPREGLLLSSGSAYSIAVVHTVFQFFFLFDVLDAMYLATEKWGRGKKSSVIIGCVYLFAVFATVYLIIKMKSMF